jgi:xanthine phosphoribosyltransferase
MSRDFIVSWDTMHRDARALAWHLLEVGSWKRVVAVARGGLVPATIVARELGIRLIDTLCLKSYDHQDQGALTILKALPDQGENTLVVDDLADTGITAKAVRQLLPQANLATVYVKPAGASQVDYWVTEVSQNTWIHLPWDLELRYQPPAVEQDRQEA